MTGVVCKLRLTEKTYQDSGPVSLLYREMGANAARQVVARALSELALIMAGIAQPEMNADDVSRQLRRLQVMSEQLGLISLSLVAGDARIARDQDDATAFSAVHARLIRVAEQSLHEDNIVMDQYV
jgi:hypothetical protein